jgi:hypothetical protein
VAFESDASLSASLLHPEISAPVTLIPDPAKHEKAHGVGGCEGRLCRLGWESLSVASAKRRTGTRGGAGQLIRARTRHLRRTMASPKLSTRQKQEFKDRYEEMKQMGVRPFGDTCGFTAVSPSASRPVALLPPA